MLLQQSWTISKIFQNSKAPSSSDPHLPRLTAFLYKDHSSSVCFSNHGYWKSWQSQVNMNISLKNKQCWAPIFIGIFFFFGDIFAKICLFILYVLLGEILFACSPCYRMVAKRLLDQILSTATSSSCQRTLSPLIYAWPDPTMAWDVWEPSSSLTLLPSFQVVPWLLLALVQCVASVCFLLVTSVSPPTCKGACLGGKASPVFPILYVFPRFLFQHFMI